MTQPAKTIVSPGTGWLVVIPSHRSIRSLTSPAVRLKARRRHETRPGGTALFGRCVWFNGPQVAERVVDDLAQVCVALGDLLAARILGGLGRRLLGDGAGPLGSVNPKAAC